MEPDYEVSTKVRFDHVTFLLGTVSVGDQPIPVAIFQCDGTIAACRIVCPDNDLDAKTWLLERLHEVLVHEQRAACHDLPYCRDCVHSILNIHNRLANWLAPERHSELLEAIANDGASATLAGN